MITGCERWRSASLAGLSLGSCQWNQRTPNCRIFRRRLVGSYLIKITTVRWPLGKRSFFAVVQTQIKGFSCCFKYIWLSKIFEKYGTVFTFKLHQQLSKNVVLRKLFWDERENKWLFSSNIRSIFPSCVTVCFVFQLPLSCHLWPWGKRFASSALRLQAEMFMPQ